MKVVTVVGARPEFIQIAPVSRALRARGHKEVLVHTGQHYDVSMSERFFEELELPRPDHNLGVGSASHGAQTAAMLERMEKVLTEERPDWVLVFGDTNSTLAGALAAAKLHVPVGHVEAGLRSYDRAMPEEINRVAVDHLADLLFTPTETGLANLRKEGLESRARLTGDVMFDSIRENLPRSRQRSTVLKDLGLVGKPFHLATVHRASNTDDPARLRGILGALAASPIPVLFPVHPRTAKKAKDAGIEMGGSLRPVEPLGYLDMIAALEGCSKVLTDSGGVQKQAYFLEKPCVTLRDTTEWVETVDLGWNVLVADDPAKIRDAMLHFKPSGKRAQPYGDGHAAERIVGLLERSPSA